MGNELIVIVMFIVGIILGYILNMFIMLLFKSYRFIYSENWVVLENKKPKRWQVCLLSRNGKTLTNVFTWDGKYFRIGISDHKYEEKIEGWRPLPSSPKFCKVKDILQGNY